MADFDESLYAHATIEQVDRFITDHAIDKSTLRLAESYAMTAVLGAEMREYRAMEANASDDDPLYWLRTTGIHKFPHLATMARNYLATPASSANTERAWSRAKHQLRPERNRLIEVAQAQAFLMREQATILRQCERKD